MSGLTDFQVEVARLFFSLPASRGFLLAGGGALLATGLTSRATQDLDFFGSPGSVDIRGVHIQFERAVAQRGWRSERIQESDSFVRLHVSADAEIVVDLAIDAPPGRPPFISVVGPTFDHEELAGRKLAALFGRAEARDFADVFVLAQRFGRSVLVARAAEVDPGVESMLLAEMLRTIDRFDDHELPVGEADVSTVRDFFRRWADEIAHEWGG